MIQASHGAGLSGITASAAKGGKGSTGGLFAKLLAILEKHSLNVAKIGVSAATNSGLEGRFSGNAGKAQNVNQATGLKNIDTDSDTALIATALQINTASPQVAQADKANHHANAGLLMSSQASDPAERQEIISGRNKQNKTLLSAGTSANSPSGHGPGDIEQTTSADKKPMLSTGKVLSAKSGAALASQTEAMSIVSSPVAAPSDKPGPAVLNKIQMNPQTIQTHLTDLTDQAETGVNFDKTADPARYKTATHLLAQSTGQKLADTQPMTTPTSVDQSSLEKVTSSADQHPRMESHLAKAGLSAGKVKGDQSSIAAQASAPLLAAHLIQHQQGGASAATTSVSAGTGMAQQMMDANSSDTSGQQSSDKGSQDGRTLLTSVDGRSNHSTAATGSSFSSYLSHKSESGMNVFDSMQYIAQSAKDGKTKLEIQLEPAHLGKINISLQTDAAKQLQVHLIVDQNSTRQVLEQQMPALRQALAQQGLDLSGFSFGSQSHGGQFDSQHRSHDGGNNVNHLTDSELPGESHPEQTRSTASQGQPLGGLSIRV